MTDKEYEKQKKRVKKIYDKWSSILGIRWYKVNLVWDREHWEEDYDTAARTTVSWQYRLVTIRLFLPVLEENNDEELTHIVIHELCHILIAPLAQTVSEDFNHYHEYAVECFACAIEWVYEAGKKAK